MPATVLRHIRANVVAYLALFVALSSTSVAAVTLQRNSVLSRHIKNGQVKRADIAKNAIDSKRVGDGSLKATDFAAGQLPAGARGPVGPPGAMGAPGAGRPSSGNGKFAGQGETTSFMGCNVGGTLVSYPVTLTAPARLMAIGSSTWYRTGGDPSTQGPAGGDIRIQLRNGADVIIAGTTPQGTAPPPGYTGSATVHGVLAPWLALTAGPMTIPAGTYELRLTGLNTGGVNCAANTGTFRDAQLTHVVLGTG